jgi:large subunit ribosomal protein L23
MKNLHQVVRRPLITEKSTLLKETQRTLCFEVHPDATKPEIKKAVETLFSVKVQDVRVTNVPGKLKRRGRDVGRRPDWKKAFVVLQKGEKMVEFFEQAGG